MLLLPLLACTADLPDRYLVVDGFGGTYGLEEVELPELEDPYRMRGTLGEGSLGGYVRAEDDRVAYTGGGPIALDHGVQDGLGVALDSDGLAMWSYYHALAEARLELATLGVDVEPLFPVDFAYQPSAGGMALTSTNAAYLGGGAHLFILLADAPDAELPLAANPMVIRHEFGHALFKLLVDGDVQLGNLTGLTERRRTLNEGFADTVSSLLLDDPDILGGSFDGLAVLARRLDGDAVADAGDDLSDPYDRGTVYASFAWDLRELTGDRELVLTAAIDVLPQVDLEAPGVEGIDAFPALLLDAVAERTDALQLDAACVAFRSRFPLAPSPARCE